MIRRVAWAIALSAVFSFISPVVPAQAAAGTTDTALAFDGTARYATAPDSATLDTFNAISIEFWMKSTAASCSGNIVGKGTDYVVYCAAGNLNYAFQSASTGATGTQVQYTASTKVYPLTPPQNEWHHFAITRAANTNQVTTYWDGQVVSNTQGADGAGSSALRQTTDPLNIGARRNSSTFFTGQIDEVRISNVVRTQAEIQQDMNNWGVGNETGVVAYYDFNDISGTTLNDRVGSSNMTLVGSPTVVPIESSSVVNGDQVVSFPRSYLDSVGGWKVPTGVSQMQSLVVAGGGAGGSRSGGGGGAGGYVATDASVLTFVPGTVESITIGAGGGGSAGGQGTNGGNSNLGNLRTALGGGGGGDASQSPNSTRQGLDGGSGGGATGANGSGLNGTNSAQYGSGKQFTNYGYGLGNNGAYAQGTNSWIGGGGGGSGGAAVIAAGSTSAYASAGGAGTLNSISGTSLCYATGGGGGAGDTTTGTTGISGYGGDCGTGANINGGQGTYGKLAGYAGLGNTGAGGGGSGWDDGVSGTDAPGGDGGSGIIIVRYSITLNTTFGAVGTATYRHSTALTVTTTLDSKVTFYANGKRIPGCGSVLTVNLVATCNWKPANHGSVPLTAITTPLNPVVNAKTSSASTSITVRSTAR